MAPSSQLQAPSSLLTSGEQAVISIFVQMAQAMGMQRSLGEIYGLLYATPRPLAFQDIVDRLGLSKGSVSQGLRFLRNVGAIQPVEVPGDRREYFEPVVELRALVGGFLREKINPQLKEWGVRAKALKIEDFARATSDELSANSSEHSASGLKAQSSELTAQEHRKVLVARIDKLRSWQKKAKLVLPMVGKLLG